MSGDPRKEFAGTGVRVQPAIRIVAGRNASMARSPGCCRSPISFLRQDLHASQHRDGG
jgi:hypothetical protein